MKNSKINFNRAPNYKEQLIGIWRHLKRERKYQLFTLLIVMLMSGLAEVFSLALVVPFLGVLTNPEKLAATPIMSYFNNLFNISNPDDLLIPITVAFALAAVLASFIKFFNSWLSFNLTALIGSDISCKAFRKILYLPYEEHLKRNSSEIISAITTQLPYAIQFINNTLRIISSLIILFFLIITLTAFNFKVSFSAIFLFCSFYVFTAKIIRKKLTKYGILFEQASKDHIKTLQESIGAMRDISLNRTHRTFLKIYKDIDYPMRKYVSWNNVLSGFPKYFLEGLSLVIIAFAAYFLASQNDEFVKIIPTLGTLAFGAQRLLPNIQETYKCWANQRSFAASVKAILDVIDQPIIASETSENIQPMKFKHNISFNNVSFRYSKNNPYIINELSLKIFKGQRIGIIGSTGCGKSTFMDLLMGLIHPISGNISIDGIKLNKSDIKRLNSWRTSIANVPQNLYLTDRSFKENIAFGMPIDEIDFKKVVSAAKKAKIADYIEKTRYGYNTFIGERGVKLSGGQKQRIGIARALYRESEIIIFDEATSSLDNSTEKKVMDSINRLDSYLTIVIIAHRLSTLANCDRVIKIEKGLIKYDGPPDIILDKL